MAGRIGILSRGLWALRDDVARLTGAEPVFVPVAGIRRVDSFAGWGHKPTAARARAAARRFGVPYLAIEDGFLRGLRPGPATRALSYVVDRTGIYYDGSGPSDLESEIGASGSYDDTLLARARDGVAFLRERLLSKYNHAPILSLREAGIERAGRPLVLVLDQVRGDASIAGAGAGAETFAAMLDAAFAENPGAAIMVKSHPDTARSGGHLGDAAGRRGAALLLRALNPWPLLAACERVYTVSSLLGFEALMAGKSVTCFGTPFYAGWGLTDDRATGARRGEGRSLDRVFAAAYLRYARYLDPYTRSETSFEEAAAALAFLRDRFHDNRPRIITVGFSPWKRRAVQPFLDGPDGPPRNAPTLEAACDLREREGGQVAIWGSRDEPPPPKLRPDLALEDGLIRSAGLGAAFVLPSSLVVDRQGLYFDARSPSAFETIAGTHVFDDELLERARRLREVIVASGVSKYNVGAPPADLPAAEGRERILVPGQVEDDASIRYGSPRVRRNVDLLAAARAASPDAFILYKPHPDVQGGLRAGRVPAADAARLADGTAADVSIAPLLAWCDTVETMTSLTGFEALLRGKRVVCHGLPFYAGWGLTEDRVETPRRTRALSLDMLTAAALILYPRYVDPLSRIPCTAEYAVARIAAQRAAPPSVSPTSRLKRLAGLQFGRLKYRLLK